MTDLLVAVFRRDGGERVSERMLLAVERAPREVRREIVREIRDRAKSERHDAEFSLRKARRLDRLADIVAAGGLPESGDGMRELFPDRPRG